MAIDAVAELARRKRSGTHTREVRAETRVELPEGAIAALKVMAAKMQEMEREAEELKQRLAQVEAPLKALAEHAALQVAEQRARDERLAQERAEYLLRKQQEDAA